MANHKSALKRIRQTEKRRIHNRYYHKTARNAVKKLRMTTDPSAAEELLPKVVSLVDRLVKRGIIHKNKSANLKSKLTKYVNKIKANAAIA
ncbi:30S ribosomal protein S20 [Schleiferia thermophila]|jgi:small subunit ribosomal protein S20|uniref:Small ribosomal subunit protein bS20 n=1 Tax=Schleiferia thermophila TaxID=884107 RepID=A0A369A2A0_9FLAO|nr:30S ribosomal protein S20 [Schleiferia thermophila]KFD39352.1 30S ribosomal protein S20 [Schleiferia thermophila str. Yellowstone]PMB29315.1 30S ribosomal protein S20 [Fischerella thermalis CCMEE 5319]RCX03283.1 SSU ribosomal protein S20P [Schleiferia thermophila]GCD80412.1 30S ribosomal protein S20 [Schleiferia thermophila]